jgi:hypothetical protein
MLYRACVTVSHSDRHARRMLPGVRRAGLGKAEPGGR